MLESGRSIVAQDSTFKDRGQVFDRRYVVKFRYFISIHDTPVVQRGDAHTSRLERMKRNSNGARMRPGASEGNARDRLSPLVFDNLFEHAWDATMCRLYNRELSHACGEADVYLPALPERAGTGYQLALGQRRRSSRPATGRASPREPARAGRLVPLFGPPGHVGVGVLQAPAAVHPVRARPVRRLTSDARSCRR
jgi:hypothetical protein